MPQLERMYRLKPHLVLAYQMGETTQVEDQRGNALVVPQGYFLIRHQTGTIAAMAAPNFLDLYEEVPLPLLDNKQPAQYLKVHDAPTANGRRMAPGAFMWSIPFSLEDSTQVILTGGLESFDGLVRVVQELHKQHMERMEGPTS